MRKQALASLAFYTAMTSLSLLPNFSFADDPSAVVSALRMSNTITGGSMPTVSPEFKSMITSIAAGDPYRAALTAVQSKYGTNYLLRRLALQMQNPGLDASIAKDNDASAFILAHFSGTSTFAPSISKIWSNNLTCSVNVTGAGGAVTTMKAADLGPEEKMLIDWKNAFSCAPGQTAVDAIATAAASDAAGRLVVVKTTIPQKHVGGYLTLSDRPEDASLAQISTTAGTNLRFVVGMWEIATGMDVMKFSSTDGARAQNVPRFVPENDPNFLVGQGQTACMSCHGGGLVSVNHGYSTLADLFNYDPGRGGFQYYTAITTGRRKSLGSDPARRENTLNCNMTNFTTCNPDSVGVDGNQAWDLATNWGSRGLLNTMGWQGAKTGQGLNALGAAIGQSGVVYTNLVKRIQREICPLGALSNSDVNAIAAIGQASDDIRQMVAQVASNRACR